MVIVYNNLMSSLLLPKDVSSKLLYVFAANYITDFDLKTSERDLRAVRIICCSELVCLTLLFVWLCANSTARKNIIALC